MFNINKPNFDKNKIAELLKTTPEALSNFENIYKEKILGEIPQKDIAKGKLAGFEDAIPEDMVTRIVNELISQTEYIEIDNGEVFRKTLAAPSTEPVTKEEIESLPLAIRPQLTGTLMTKEVNGDTYTILAQMWAGYLNATNPKKKKDYYNLFKQGLDMQDLDAITYMMLDTNPNSMSHWLPQIMKGVSKQSFFKVPNTKIIKVPVTLLQLSRLDYNALTPTTLKIVDEYCKKAFCLDLTKDYFIKTGTYSSKFDFRNAHVTGEKEVSELGEYLLYISHQAVLMAGSVGFSTDKNGQTIMFKKPVCYGVSTTTEWVVRDYIQDVESNPTIYNGLPLRTEYRAFVDFDTKEVFGVHPYWDIEVMRDRFNNSPDCGRPEMIHDAITLESNAERLMKRYEENSGIVEKALEKLISEVDELHGQYSVDIMQNGNDFYLIDMALAQNSAFNEVIPENKRAFVEENWIPSLE